MFSGCELPHSVMKSPWTSVILTNRQDVAVLTQTVSTPSLSVSQTTMPGKASVKKKHHDTVSQCYVTLANPDCKNISLAILTVVSALHTHSDSVMCKTFLLRTQVRQGRTKLQDWYSRNKQVIRNCKKERRQKSSNFSKVCFTQM